MITAIIIDDEKGNRENLRNLLDKHFKQVSILAEAASAISGIEAIQTNRPDVVFLDIEMPKGSGFDLLEKLPNNDFEVIFVTAFDRYAIRAIKFCAMDYLLKPLDINELKQAIDKVEQKVFKQQENKRLRVFLQNMKAVQETKCIALPTADRVDFVPIDQIIRCKGENNYTDVFLINGKRILVSKTLKEYEELLSEYNFLRVHQSHLVNLKKVSTYIKRDGGYLLMCDGSEVRVSQMKKSKLLARLMN